MATNKLLDGKGKGGGKVTKESLFEYADRLNKQNWVIASGDFYFINKMPGKNGEPVHFLDRKSLRA